MSKLMTGNGFGGLPPEISLHICIHQATASDKHVVSMEEEQIAVDVAGFVLLSPCWRLPKHKF
jgi:hypothetical protein